MATAPGEAPQPTTGATNDVDIGAARPLADESQLTPIGRPRGAQPTPSGEPAGSAAAPHDVEIATSERDRSRGSPVRRRGARGRHLPELCSLERGEEDSEQRQGRRAHRQQPDGKPPAIAKPVEQGDEQAQVEQDDGFGRDLAAKGQDSGPVMTEELEAA